MLSLAVMLLSRIFHRPPAAPKPVTFTYDPDDRQAIDNLTLLGTWDEKGRYDKHFRSVPMHRDADGCWRATVPLVDQGCHHWRWQVLGDTPAGPQQKVTFDPQPLAFSPSGPAPSYAPTQLHRLGALHRGADVRFSLWAPYARDVQVRLWRDDPAHPTRIPMQHDVATGRWTCDVPGGWKQWEGACYAYEITRREGDVVVRSDPYGRFRMGQLRGVAEVLLDPVTGQEAPPFNPEKGGTPSLPFIRFEVQGHTDADCATVRLYDENGHPLDRAALLQRLGTDHGDLVKHYHHDQFSDFWADNVDASGGVSLVKQGGAWGAMFNTPDKLAGLTYRIELRKDGKLLGDANGDGVFSAEEAKATAWNDPYGAQMDGNFGYDRYNVLHDCDAWKWSNDRVPRMARKPTEMVIYELHVGSFLGDSQNVHRSTFKDVMDRLDYLKALGVNTLEFLPTNAFEGARDWGYVGTNSLGIAEQYGFEDAQGHWVSGVDALKQLIDAAHGKGFRVLSDVVYNHFGQLYDDLWETDSKQNPYFDWGGGRGPLGRQSGKTKPGPWGPLPAYKTEAVRQFIIDNAMQQLDELHFDGLRVDAAEIIHLPIKGGGKAGWTLLQTINQEAHTLHPQARMNAEQFPNYPRITRTVSEGGLGFDTEWNHNFHRLLVSGMPLVSGLLARAAQGRYTPMNLFMDYLRCHPGFSEYTHMNTIITNHDEVGNGARTANVATQQGPGAPLSPWARNACRTTFGVGMMSPGHPFLFQGEESLAQNTFRWGLPSTWDVGWEWEHGTDATSEARRHHFTFCRDAIALRNEQPALQADGAFEPVRADNHNSVMAFRREKNGEQFLVVASLHHGTVPQWEVPVDGDWELVLNSDSPRYGGSGQTVAPMLHGHSRVDVPDAGLLVYRRVSRPAGA
ncbi:MAG: alpha-amylase family glycosyl hydrolase [Candidatus Xenobia bacterium]